MDVPLTFLDEKQWILPPHEAAVAEKASHQPSEHLQIHSICRIGRLTHRAPDIGELSRSFAVDDDTVAHTSPVEGKLQNSRLYSIITRM